MISYESVNYLHAGDILFLNTYLRISDLKNLHHGSFYQTFISY